MASVNWQKQTRQKASAMKKHNGQQERMQYNHANKTIDKERTPENYCIGCDDYNTAFNAMVKRVEAIDKEYPPEKITKDRKICCSLETPCPLEITKSGRSREFFEAIHEVMVDFFGADNVHGACVHLDEVHDYIDEKTGELKTSLEHSTELVSCYAEWQDAVWERDENGRIKTEPAFDKKGNPLLDKDGNQKERRVQAKDEAGALLFAERKGINGKHFETRSALNELNKRVCDMVREKFGIEYNTGEQARCKTVETLKAQTAELEAKTKLAEILKELAELDEQARTARLSAIEIPLRPVEREQRSYPLAPPAEYTFYDKQEMKEYKKQWSNYRSACREVDKYNKEASKYNAQIKLLQEEWDRTYLPLQTLKDETQKLAEERARQKAKDIQLKQIEKALKLREKSIDEEVKKRCDEQLARSDRYVRFRTNQQSSADYQQKLQTIYETAKERNENYDSKSISSKQNRSERTKQNKELGGR